MSEEKGKYDGFRAAMNPYVARKVKAGAAYMVRPGDTLSEIAQRICGDRRRYTEMRLIARSDDRPPGPFDPDIIYPGDVFNIPFRFRQLGRAP